METRRDCLFIYVANDNQNCYVKFVMFVELIKLENGLSRCLFNLYGFVHEFVVQIIIKLAIQSHTFKSFTKLKKIGNWSFQKFRRISRNRGKNACGAFLSGSNISHLQCVFNKGLDFFWGVGGYCTILPLCFSFIIFIT